MFVFDRFEVGKVYGRYRTCIEAEFVDAWRRQFPDDPAVPAVPIGYVSVLMMHAYFAVIAPRPPGNIHAGQEFVIHALPAVGDDVEIEVKCISKEVRGRRRFVWLGFEAVDRARKQLFSATMTSLVAA